MAVWGLTVCVDSKNFMDNSKSMWANVENTVWAHYETVDGKNLNMAGHHILDNQKANTALTWGDMVLALVELCALRVPLVSHQK